MKFKTPREVSRFLFTRVVVLLLIVRNSHWGIQVFGVPEN
jgi:hypothetical protein